MNSMFLRDLIRNCYALSIITLLFYGYFSMKPAALATASTLTAASAGRGINQRLSSKPLKEALKGQLGEIQELYAQVELLKQALQENYGWHERFKSADAEAQRVQAELNSAQIKVRELIEWNESYQVEERTWEEKAKARMEPLKGEIDRLKKACEHYQKQYQQSSEEYNATVDRNSELVAQIEYLKVQLQALLAPKRLNGELPEQKMADEIANWFGKAEQPIKLHTESASVNGQDWQLILTLVEPRDRNRIQEFAKWLQNDFSLVTTPTIKLIGDDRVRITVIRGEMTNESRYLKVDPAWLKDALVFTKNGRIVTHHARFSGSTETGKSTLVSNAVGCIIRHIPLIEIQLADPLTAGMSEWASLTPRFKGEAECVVGLMEFYAEFKRLDQGEEKSDRPKVFIMDEFDRMMKNYPDLVAIVLDLWKSGRHQQRYFWAIGQSVLVGKFGLNTEDTQNVTGFYLGQTIDRGLTDANDNPEYNVRLREQLHLCRAKDMKYVCLCRPMTVTGRPFLAVMPKPGEYATGNLEAHSIAENKREEDQLNGRAIEFDLDDVRDNLERLVQGGSDVEPKPEPDPTLGLTKSELGKVKRLLSEGLSAAKIINQVWGLKPSGKDEYKNRKKQVDHLKKQG